LCAFDQDGLESEKDDTDNDDDNNENDGIDKMRLCK